jgi:hypothetical protein
MVYIFQNRYCSKYYSNNEYCEVFTEKKHICPNRGNKPSRTTTTTTKDREISPPSTAPKPRYYNPYAKKRTPYTSLTNQHPKPKMSNSFEYLQGSIIEIQKKYEILSDIVTEYGSLLFNF